LHIGLGHRCQRNRARVVDDNVERAEARNGLGNRALDRALVAHVDNQRQGLAAGLFDCLRRRIDRAFELVMRGLRLGCDRDIGAVAGGAQRDREPDTARSTGDEEGLAFERYRRHRLRAKNASKATFASGEFKRSLKILASSSMRASNSSVAPRVRARESATAPAGSAAISRAAFKPSVSTS